MKIRNGFVSNSSSSSFVVAFPEMPQSVEHVRQMMFGNEKFLQGPYPKNWTTKEYEYYETSGIAETVWRDIKDQETNDIENISRVFQVGYLDSDPEFNWDAWSDDQNKRFEMFEKHRKLVEKSRKFEMKKFMKQVKDKFVYCFSYSDNDGEYFSMMEHGEIFASLFHIRISCH